MWFEVWRSYLFTAIQLDVTDLEASGPNRHSLLERQPLALKPEAENTKCCFWNMNHLWKATLWPGWQLKYGGNVDFTVSYGLSSSRNSPQTKDFVANYLLRTCSQEKRSRFGRREVKEPKCKCESLLHLNMAMWQSATWQDVHITSKKLLYSLHGIQV